MLLLGVAVLVAERLPDGRRRGVSCFCDFSTACFVLSELLLFHDLQTFVSVVAFASEYPRYARWHKGFTAAYVLAVSYEKLICSFYVREARAHGSATVPPHVRSSAHLSQ